MNQRPNLISDKVYYVRRQRAGSQEFGDKAIHEDQAEYNTNNYDEEGDDQE